METAEIRKSAWHAATHTYEVVRDGKVVFTGSWRECFDAAREVLTPKEDDDD